MKTLFIILSALAVIASAAANNSNAICNGQIGNHGIQDGGSSYISCIQKTDGEVVAEIQNCPEEQIWDEETRNCEIPEERNIHIIVNNIVADCGDSSSSESDSSSSSSSSESEEEEEPGCNLDDHVISEDPHDCSNYCCVLKTSGLFGSSFRGGQDPKNGCASCGHKKFYCKHKQCCVSTDDHECRDELLHRCDCKKIPHPHDCNKFYYDCDDIDEKIEGSCNPGELFYQHAEGHHKGGCVAQGHSEWSHAVGACLCHGKMPVQVDCFGWKCCHYSHSIFGLETNNNCGEVHHCDSDTFFCGSSNTCMEFTEIHKCEDPYKQHCCHKKGHCHSYEEKCEIGGGQQHTYPEVHCPDGEQFCTNHGECKKPEHSECHSNCKCGYGSDIFLIGNRRCCVRSDSSSESESGQSSEESNEHSNWWKNLIKPNPANGQCFYGGIDCDDCTGGTSPCGYACVDPNTQCHHQVPHLVDACKECNGQPTHLPCWNPFRLNGKKKHDCNKMTLCKHNGSKWVLDETKPAGLCHHKEHQTKPGEDVLGFCKGCTMQQLIDCMRDEFPGYNPGCQGRCNCCKA